METWTKASRTYLQNIIFFYFSTENEPYWKIMETFTRLKNVSTLAVIPLWYGALWHPLIRVGCWISNNVKINQPILVQCHISITPENIRIYPLNILYFIARGELALNSPKISGIHFFQMILELVFMFTTAALYSYLLYFVRRSARKLTITRNIHSEHSYIDQLTKSVFLIYLCLILLTLPQVAGLVFWLFHPAAVLAEMSTRKTFGWSVLTLYANSYVNALILIYRLRKQWRVPLRRYIQIYYKQSLNKMEVVIRMTFCYFAVVKQNSKYIIKL